MRYVSIALLLIASSADAENWVEVAKLDTSGAVLFVDADAIMEVKGLRRAWFKSVYTADQPVAEEYLAKLPKDFRFYRSEVSLRYFNCAHRTSGVPARRRGYQRRLIFLYASRIFRAMAAFKFSRRTFM
jgi:hypothetical protein